MDIRRVQREEVGPVLCRDTLQTAILIHTTLTFEHPHRNTALHSNPSFARVHNRYVQDCNQIKQLGHNLVCSWEALRPHQGSETPGRTSS